MELTSPAFENKEEIPKRFTADGADISPPLKISGVAENVRSLALIMDDPDAPGKVFDHWLIWDIPSEITEIEEGIERKAKVVSLSNAQQGRNDFGELGYRGPAPPSGKHHYRFKLYGLDEVLDLSPGLNKSKLLDRIKNSVIDKTELVGVYRR